MAITNSYLTSTKNLESIINSVINAKAPERFTNKFLEDLGYKSSNDRLVIGMFKALGLLDDNGQPLQRYYEFLDQTQTGRIIAIGIEEAYEDLFNLRKDAQNLTNDEVKNKLKTITQGQKSDKILGLMAMTFRAFCDLADWDSVGTEETNKIETPHVVLKSKLCHIMIAIPSSWCGIELGVNGSLLKVRPNILFLNFIAPSFLARSLAGHLAAFE